MSPARSTFVGLLGGDVTITARRWQAWSAVVVVVLAFGVGIAVNQLAIARTDKVVAQLKAEQVVRKSEDCHTAAKVVEMIRTVVRVAFTPLPVNPMSPLDVQAQVADRNATMAAYRDRVLNGAPSIDCSPKSLAKRKSGGF